jgi:hypothetical protein
MIKRRNVAISKFYALREVQSPVLRFGDGSPSALMPSVLDKAFKGEL